MSDEELSKLQKVAEKAKVSETPAHALMNPKVISIYNDARIYSAVYTLASHKISGAPVVDKTERLVGIITEYDLLLQAATQDVSGPIKYNKNVLTVQPDTTLKDIIVLFYKKKLKWCPVVGAGHKVQGIVSRIDVLNRLLQQPK